MKFRRIDDLILTGGIFIYFFAWMTGVRDYSGDALKFWIIAGVIYTLIAVAIVAFFRGFRVWLFDKFWTLRFFIREWRWNRKIKKREDELLMRKTLETVEPAKLLSEYERFEDGQLMWAWVKYYLPIQTGIYDRANDCIAFYYDRAMVASFQHFIQYGKLKIAENEGSRDGPPLNGPYYDIYKEEQRKENLTKVILDNAKSYEGYKSDWNAQLAPASEARKIVLC